MVDSFIFGCYFKSQDLWIKLTPHLVSRQQKIVGSSSIGIVVGSKIMVAIT